MDKFLTKYRRLVSTVDGELRVLPFQEHGILTALLLALSALFLLGDGLLLMVCKFVGWLLLACGVYIGFRFKNRPEHDNDYVDVE